MSPTLLASLLVLLQPAYAAEKPPVPTVGPRELVIDGDPVPVLLPPGAIPAVMEPEWLDAAEADALYLPGEPVLGVALDGQAVAYSLWHLDRHEIVNDVVGGTPIAATW